MLGAKLITQTSLWEISVTPNDSLSLPLPVQSGRQLGGSFKEWLGVRLLHPLQNRLSSVLV